MPTSAGRRDLHSDRLARQHTSQSEGSYWSSQREEQRHEVLSFGQDVNEATSNVRRRNRQINQCLECRRRKLKCDRRSPCAHCIRIGRNCMYMNPALDARSQQRFAAVKDKMSLLEQKLGHANSCSDASRSHKESSTVDVVVVEVSPPLAAATQTQAWDSKEIPLKSTPMATLDNVYDNIYDDGIDDEIMDLGVQIGKLRIAERIGGWVRPKLVEELNSTLHDVKAQTGENASAFRSDVNSRLSIGSMPQAAGYIGPEPEYIAPASDILFSPHHTHNSPLDHLPAKKAADTLITHYATAVHLIAPALHLPTFREQYALFWLSIASGVEPIASRQAVLFAVLFSAALSMNKNEVEDKTW